MFSFHLDKLEEIYSKAYFNRFHLYLQGITGIPGVGGIRGDSGEKVFFVALRLLKLFLNTDYVISNYLIHDVQNEF